MTAEEFVGKEFREKYEDIWPIIRLITSQMDVLKKAGLIGYDGVWPRRTPFRYSISKPLRWILYLIHYIRLHNRQCYQGDSIYLSDTMLYAERYRGLLEKLYDTRNIVASCSIHNINRSLFFPENELDQKIFLSRNMFFGESFIGATLKNCVEQVYDLFVELRQENKCCQDQYERTDKVLTELQLAVHQRVDIITEKLKRAHVKCFITINQHNLCDVLMIMACRKSKIWTKELSHCSRCLLPTEDNKISNLYFEQKKRARVFYANESCHWSISEKEYCLKYIPCEFVFKDATIQHSVVGCPELTRDEFLKNTEEYEKEQALIFFVPSAAELMMELGVRDYVGLSAEKVQKTTKKKEEIYIQLAALAKKQSLKVYIRYHPGENQIFTDADKPLLDSLGFEVLSPEREALIRGICSSKIALGQPTSALILALIYGCKCYTIKVKNTENYDFCGLDISLIDKDKIQDITFEQNKESQIVEYINPDILCQYPTSIM